MPKLIATISLFIFWAAVTAILSVGLVYYQKEGSSVNSNIATSTISSSTTDPVTVSKNLVAAKSLILNSTEIAKHNSLKDCWLLISGKVYNLTSYIPGHPGGLVLVPYCGRDGTSSFLNGPPHSHSSFAQSLLDQYYIGDLNQTTNTEQIQQNVQNTNTVTPPTLQSGDDDEVDDD